MTAFAFLLTLLCPAVTYQTVRPDLPVSLSVAESLFKLCSFNSFHHFALLFKKHLGGVWFFPPLITVVIASDLCRVGWVSQPWCLLSLAAPLSTRHFPAGVKQQEGVQGSCQLCRRVQKQGSKRQQQVHGALLVALAQPQQLSSKEKSLRALSSSKGKSLQVLSSSTLILLVLCSSVKVTLEREQDGFIF